MRNYVMNMETLKIELYFEKSEYDQLTDDQKKKIKSNFLWSRAKGAWVSRAKEPNLWNAKRVAQELGFEGEERQGERLSFAEQLERRAERAEARAERMEVYAENAEKRASEYQKEFNKYKQDWSWLTQPIIAGHSGSQRFARQREKVINRYEKGFDEYRKSEYFKERAEAARMTASMPKLKDLVYLEKRIKECESEIRRITGSIVRYEDMLYAIEIGRTVKRYDGTEITAEEVGSWLKNAMERMEAEMDKQGFYQNCMDELGGIKFSADNLKAGYIVDVAGWGRCEVIKTNPKSVDIKTSRGSVFRESYGAVREVIEAVEKINDEQHPYKEGDIVAKYAFDGHTMRRAYKIVKATAKTVKLAPIRVRDNKAVPDEVIDKAIVRKPVISRFTNEWSLYDGDWALYKVDAEHIA